MIMSAEAIREMSKLAIVRHGDYSFTTDRLTPRGWEQIYNIGEQLKTRLKKNQVAHILTSPEKRAEESARILADILKAPVEEHELLYSDGSHPEDLDEAYKLIQALRSKADLGVVVTHMEYANSLPSFIGEKDLGISHYPREVRKGEAALIDYISKRITYLR